MSNIPIQYFSLGILIVNVVQMVLIWRGRKK